MPATLKIENARFVLTLDGARRIIRDGAIVIEGQRVAQVGKTAELKSVAAERVIDASEMVATPGFINGHMHISYAHAVRGIFPDDLNPADYLAHVFALQGAMTDEEEYYTTLLGLTELLKYGTTCLLDPGTTKFLDAAMQAYRETGCRIIVGRQVVDRPNPLNLPVMSTEAALAATTDALRRYDNQLDGRVRAWAMPFASDYCSPELLRGLKRLADEHNTRLTLHQNNATGQVALHLREYGKRPVIHLADLGVLGPNVTLAHAVGLDAAEVAALAQAGAAAVLCPSAALKMGLGLTGKSLLPEMLAQGVPVGLGTDAANNSNLIETLRSVYLTATLYKDARQTTQVIPPETALEMATIKGAEALGLADVTGSIEPGKQADLVLFDTRRPEWRSLFNPVNNLVYSADGRSVHTVLVAGRVVVENHRPTYVDEWKLIQRVQEIGESLLARTGVSFAPRWPME